MLKSRLFPVLTLCSALFFISLARADESTPPTAPPATVPGTPANPPSDKGKFDLFLLIGQSNMAGRAPVTDADRAADSRVLVFNQLDQWYSQGEPIHFDQPGRTGVGPAFAFAKLYADKNPSTTVGLIPCAFGGTSLAKWSPTSKSTQYYPPDNLYNNAVRRARLAMQAGTLKGILWLQGESDSTPQLAPTYAATLAQLVAQLRADLGTPDVPFIAGEIGYFNYSKHPDAQTVNQQIDSLPTLIPHSGIVSAGDLKDKGDHLHFDNASQKILAGRFLEIYLKVEAAH